MLNLLVFSYICRRIEFKHHDSRDIQLTKWYLEEGTSEKRVLLQKQCLQQYEGCPDVSRIYKETLHAIEHESPLSLLSIPFVYCDNCDEIYMTDKVFCEECGKAFIKSCKYHHISDSHIQSVPFHERQNCSLRCNCSDAIPNTPIFYGASIEGYICMLIAFGYTNSLVATTPSTQLLHAEYCKSIGSITSTNDLNTAKLWEHIGMSNVSDFMKQCVNHSIPTPSTNGLKKILNNGHEDDLFHIGIF